LERDSKRSVRLHAVRLVGAWPKLGAGLFGGCGAAFGSLAVQEVRSANTPARGWTWQAPKWMIGKLIIASS